MYVFINFSYQDSLKIAWKFARFKVTQQTSSQPKNYAN